MTKTKQTTVVKIYSDGTRKGYCTSEKVQVDEFFRAEKTLERLGLIFGKDGGSLEFLRSSFKESFLNS